MELHLIHIATSFVTCRGKRWHVKELSLLLTYALNIDLNLWYVHLQLVTSHNECRILDGTWNRQSEKTNDRNNNVVNFSFVKYVQKTWLLRCFTSHREQIKRTATKLLYGVTCKIRHFNLPIVCQLDLKIWQNYLPYHILYMWNTVTFHFID